VGPSPAGKDKGAADAAFHKTRASKKRTEKDEDE
jgi:hypothetical protein